MVGLVKVYGDTLGKDLALLEKRSHLRSIGIAARKRNLSCSHSIILFYSFLFFFIVKLSFCNMEVSVISILSGFSFLKLDLSNILATCYIVAYAKCVSISLTEGNM